MAPSHSPPLPPSPDYPSDDLLAIDPALAASMGFSGFGMQPAAKKRRHNPATEMVADIQTPFSTTGSKLLGTQSLPAKTPPSAAGGSRGQGSYAGGTWRENVAEVSGSNKTPLGVGRTGKAIATGAVARDAGGLDLEVGVGGDPGQQDPGYRENTAPGSPPGGGAAGLNEAVLAPPGVTDGMGSVDGSGAADGGSTGYNWGALRKGVRNERGDVVYYDASFVEDPWRQLMVQRAQVGTTSTRT